MHDRGLQLPTSEVQPTFQAPLRAPHISHPISASQTLCMSLGVEGVRFAIVQDAPANLHSATVDVRALSVEVSLRTEILRKQY